MKILTTRNTLLLAALLTALSATAQAQTERSAEYVACMERAEDSQYRNAEWNSCIGAELALQDSVLNAEYQTLKASLSTEQKDSLLQGQRAWLKYREDWCRFTEQGNSAPGGEINYNLCRMDLTDKQIELIKAEQS